MGVDALMLEIQFHETATALEFVKRQAMSLRRGLGEDLHAVADADGRAAELILAGLEHRTEAIGTKFSGYAPVLIAVARRIASERNPMALVQELGAGVEAVSLRGIVGAILEREKSKLERLQLSDLGLRDRLYGKEEQVDRLVSAIYDIDHVPTLPAMSERDAEIYRNALEGWVPDQSVHRRIRKAAVIGSLRRFHHSGSSEEGLGKREREGEGTRERQGESVYVGVSLAGQMAQVQRLGIRDHRRRNVDRLGSYV